MEQPQLLFENIYARTRDAALRYITSKCLSISDIDDIYQDTFLNVYRSVCNMKSEIENEEAFVINIAKKCLSRYYGVAAKLRAQVSIGLSRLPEKSSTGQQAAEADVEMLVLDHALCDDIFETVSSMSIDVQRIIYMYYVLDMPLSAVGQSLGLREDQVKNKLYRALERIRRMYKRREML